MSGLVALLDIVQSFSIGCPACDSDGIIDGSDCGTCESKGYLLDKSLFEMAHARRQARAELENHIQAHRYLHCVCTSCATCGECILCQECSCEKPNGLISMDCDGEYLVAREDDGHPRGKMTANE